MGGNKGIREGKRKRADIEREGVEIGGETIEWGRDKSGGRGSERIEDKNRPRNEKGREVIRGEK